ncbi:MAG: MMPL family transporter [Proteobacteria bacterium]|nr:MMPL family transporter [Pseudomonadota bacterium]
MKKIKIKIDDALRDFALAVFDRPCKALLLLGLFVLFTFAFIPFNAYDVSTRGNFQKADEVLKKYNAFKKQFGSDSSVLVALYPENVFDREFLSTLRNFQEELEREIPYLDEVTSLLTITAIKGENGDLVIEDLFEKWPETETELRKIKTYVMNHPDYKYNIISEKADYTLVIIRADAFLDEGRDDFMVEADVEVAKEESWYSPVNSFMKYMNRRFRPKIDPDDKTELTAAQNHEIVAKVFEIAEKFRSESFPMFVTGSPVIDKLHVDIIGSTFRRTIGLSILAMFLILFLVFRSLVGIFIPLMIVGFSLGSTFGLMPVIGIPVRITSQVFPPMILAAGICDAVHLLSIFYQKFSLSGNKRDSIGEAMRHSGLAMFFTTLTTAGGFLSFSLAELRGIAEVGICAAMGVGLALVYTYLLVPALISLLPIKAVGRRKTGPLKKDWERFLETVAGFAVAKPMLVLIPTFFVLIISAVGAAKIEFSFNMIKWFPEETRIEANNITLEKYFKTSNSLEVVVDTGKENGIFEPEVMNAIERAQIYAESFTTGPVTVGKTSSIVNSLKLINRTLNNDSPEFYRIPQDRSTIAQEMILFENSGWDNLRDIVDTRFSKTRITIGVPMVNSVKYVDFKDEIEKELMEIFSGLADVYVTGGVDIGARSIWGLIKTLSESYLLAFVTIALLMMLLIGSFRIGLISMIPNFLPILISLGLMGYFGIPITIFTVLMGGIALGLAVDDTIHFLHNFKRSFDESKSIKSSIRDTVQTTGRALFFTTSVMSAGFFAYLAADMNVLVTFGIVAGTTIILAFLSDIIITPALVSLVFRSREKTTEITYPTVYTN